MLSQFEKEQLLKAAENLARAASDGNSGITHADVQVAYAKGCNDFSMTGALYIMMGRIGQLTRSPSVCAGFVLISSVLVLCSAAIAGISVFRYVAKALGYFESNEERDGILDKLANLGLNAVVGFVLGCLPPWLSGLVLPLVNQLSASIGTGADLVARAQRLGAALEGAKEAVAKPLANAAYGAATTPMMPLVGATLGAAGVPGFSLPAPPTPPQPPAQPPAQSSSSSGGTLNAIANLVSAFGGLFKDASYDTNYDTDLLDLGAERARQLGLSPTEARAAAFEALRRFKSARGLD